MSVRLSLKSDQEFAATIDARRRLRMEVIDRLDPELKACVHEFGWTVVRAFLDLKITQPRHIRHLVNITLDELSAVRGAASAQGLRVQK